MDGAETIEQPRKAGYTILFNLLFRIPLTLFGVLGVITCIVLITGANYTVANRSFALINQVPDRVTRWFEANDHGDESHNVNAAVGIVTGGARAALGGLTQGGKGAMVAAMGGKKGKGTDASGQGAKADAPKAPGAPSAVTTEH